MTKVRVVFQPPPEAMWAIVPDEGAAAPIVPVPDSEKEVLVDPVAVPLPVIPVNVPVVPTNLPVPPIILTVPVADDEPPICGIRTPGGIEKVPTRTSVPEKISVNVPEIGPKFDSVELSIMPAPERAAFPNPVRDPVPPIVKL